MIRVVSYHIIIIIFINSLFFYVCTFKKKMMVKIFLYIRVNNNFTKNIRVIGLKSKEF